MKTAELLNEWLTTYERERVKPRTYARYEGLINLHIAPALGEVEINELCRRQIQEFLTRKKKDGNIKQNGESLSATSIVISALDTEVEAKNLLAYLKTKFARFMVAQVTPTQHIAKANFCYVPFQDFSKTWTDTELYAKYNLSEEEIAFIEATIKPIE